MIRLYPGNVLDRLRELPAESVHTVVTSPPYWGLRAYGTEPQVWGGSWSCAHVWGADLTKKGGAAYTFGQKAKWQHEGGERPQGHPEIPAGNLCQHCGAWRGELGLEPTLDLFLAHLVEVFREVRRVLRRDGTCWVNLGDSYATAPNGRSAADQKATGTDDRTFRDKPFGTAGNGLKSKDLCMIPHRFAIAAQADGWWVRSDVVWAKPNPMPESITDRPTKAHEYVFLLTRSERYFYDADAVREASVSDHDSGNGYARPEQLSRGGRGQLKGWTLEDGLRGRNLRSVWTIPTQAYPEAHFATFPEELAQRCIAAGTSEHGACGACGAPWRRVAERMGETPRQRLKERGPCMAAAAHVGNPQGLNYAGGHGDNRREVVTLGWEPSCTCGAGVTPCTVLDPFAGSGTVGAVAVGNGRHASLIELQPQYCDLIRKRCGLFLETTR